MPRRHAIYLALACVCGLLGATAARVAKAENARPYGLNVHAPSGADLAQIFDATQAAGFGWVRVDFVWATIEPAPGEFDFRASDAIVDAAAIRGLSVLAILGYTPDWATDGPVGSGVPRSAAEWQTFCARVATRYAGQVERFEIWNEPNLPQFWAGSRAEYIDVILRPGAAAVHAANPSARIGGPGLAHLVSGDSDWYRWLYDVLQTSADSLDFVTHHVYDSDGDTDVSKKLTGSTQFANQPSLWDIQNPSLREVLKYQGWYPARPIWLTETGWNSSQVGDAAQAQYTAGFLNQWFTGVDGHTWLDRAFIYAARDGIGTDQFGLMHADGRPKPAYEAVKSFIAAHQPAPPEAVPLKLLGSRFSVVARWRTSDGTTGVGHPVPLTDQSGEFWFFDQGNIELVVKSLDGRGLNRRFWFFYGALSDVEYWLTVTDTVTHAVKEYHNLQGNICGRADTGAFRPTAASVAPQALELFEPEPPLAAATVACVAGYNTLCLQGGRFSVSVTYHDHSGGGGDAHAVPATNESGQFWFFDPTNIELVLKVLDGRRVNGKWWVLWGALSDVEYDVTVTDTTNGKTW
ncbi:MAG: cellulase family glycosylhydrolase, partial [Acidobacteriota bacterium]